MAKTPAKSAPKAAPTKPAKLSSKSKGAAASPKVSEKPAKAPKSTVAKGAATTKPKKVSAAKAATAVAASSGIAQFAKDATDAASKLASDILADRIVPTIDQIKAVAAHALGKGEPVKAEAKPKTKPKASKKK